MTDAPSILPLSLKDLGYSVNGKSLLRNISVTLQETGITTIIGPNGAGKSLLLRLCHGLLLPSSGHVEWQRKDGFTDGQKRHAMVFQNPVVLRRSARANIAHALKAVGVRDAASKTQDALQRFGLSALKDQPARLLSGGEKQRLAIARAWALDPQLMFLDEPTSQLDPSATRQIEETITKLASEGVTILMSTHDLGQAKRLSQRILFLHQGRLIADTPTSEFFEQPPTPECRAFVAGDLLW
jgi:tungstate transport system ATP-binding protein